MAESKFDCKHPDERLRNLKGFSGSLALRVLFVTLIFLVVPLFIYSLIRYQYEYALKKEQVSLSLNLIGEEQIFMEQQLTNFELKTLELLSLAISNKEVGIETIFQKAAEFEEVQDVFLLEKRGQDDVVCTASYQKIFKNEFYKQLIVNPLLNERLYGVFFQKTQDKGTIYFVKVLKRNEKNEPIQTLNLSISTEFFVEYLSRVEGYHSSYEISLMTNQEPTVFQSQVPIFLNKQLKYSNLQSKKQNEFLNLKKLPFAENTYEFYAQGKLFYAIVVPLAEMNFSLLITTPKFEESLYLKEYFYELLILFIFIILFGLLATFFITFMMAKPLKNLCLVMEKVRKEDLSARYENYKFGFEINTVGNYFNAMIENLISHGIRIEEYRLKKERLEQELVIGEQIQSELIPKEYPHLSNMQISAKFLSAKEVGGDFYDFTIREQNKNEIALIIADTSGHGIFGCLYSLSFRSMAKSFCTYCQNLEEAIKKTNALFYQDSHKNNVFVTAWMGFYNKETKKLQYASCGHPFAFLFKNNLFAKEMDTPGMALGVDKALELSIAEINIEKGDILVLFTDGVTESSSPSGELFGKKRLIKSLEKHLAVSFSTALENVYEEIKTFTKAETPQMDDYTMVLISLDL